MAGKGRGLGRIARRQPLESFRFDRSDLEELTRLSVFHRFSSPIHTIAGRDRDPSELGAGPNLVRQGLAKARQRSSRSGLDGPEWPAEPLGDLGLGELCAVGEDERDTFLLRQFRQGATDDVAKLGRCQLTLRTGTDLCATQHRPAGHDPFERGGLLLVRSGRRR
jgi:hypothetical protein